MFRKAVFSFVGALVALVFASSAAAQGGMWPLNQLPADALKRDHGFTVTPAWVEHVQRASLRLPNCSASFVTPSLVATNGHCVEEAVQALSTPANNLYENGFYAGTPDKELKTTLTLRQLVTMEDVTVRVRAAASPRQEIQGIAAASSKSTGLTCEVVTLYLGAQYHNYCYKVYTDVRLVFSTGTNEWFFGGDYDNFNYPRYVIDMGILRVYENGKPVQSPYYFKWSTAGVSEGDLVFISGHPGSTKRMFTSAALRTERDVIAPFLLSFVRRLEIMTQQFALRGAEERRVTRSDLFGWENTRKLYIGKMLGLQDPRLMRDKEAFEAKMLVDAAGDPALTAQIREGLDLVASAQTAIGKAYPRLVVLRWGFGGPLAALEANDSSLNRAYVEAQITEALGALIETYGAEDPAIAGLLGGLGPAELAHRVAYDPQNSLADFSAKISDMVDAVRSAYVPAAAKAEAGYAKLADAAFALYGANVSPDATFTLRLAFGYVKGYDENGKAVPAWTTLGGAFEHAAAHGNEGAYRIPDTWQRNKKSLKLTTPFNFLSTLDITGGNSGSPVITRDLKFVGVAFDSNIHGLVSDYDYDYDPRARAIAVDSRGILELLKNAYHADALVRELTGK